MPLLLQPEQTPTASPENCGAESEGFCPREDARPGEAGSSGACEVLLERPDEGDADNADPEEEDDAYRGDASCTRDGNRTGSADVPAALVLGALCDAPCIVLRNAANWAGAPFA
ncbi:hypothetical protein HPB51_026692 [Rhipicephalus microplus]|uniref:Uncharacterized protein n=1 Tax=Rhipicephalus microplus TaxID=6941 RepID=A0A9J6D2D8_RHIMP|nr:hypothetical protein HPB51_026692 [Rhipicephalus microplus]